MAPMAPSDAGCHSTVERLAAWLVDAALVPQQDARRIADRCEVHDSVALPAGNALLLVLLASFADGGERALPRSGRRFGRWSARAQPMATACGGPGRAVHGWLAELPSAPRRTCVAGASAGARPELLPGGRAEARRLRGAARSASSSRTARSGLGSGCMLKLYRLLEPGDESRGGAAASFLDRARLRPRAAGRGVDALRRRRCRAGGGGACVQAPGAGPRRRLGLDARAAWAARPAGRQRRSLPSRRSAASPPSCIAALQLDARTRPDFPSRAASR